MTACVPPLDLRDELLDRWQLDAVELEELLKAIDDRIDTGGPVRRELLEPCRQAVIRELAGHVS